MQTMRAFTRLKKSRQRREEYGGIGGNLWEYHCRLSPAPEGADLNQSSRSERS